jgi:hypothetical protein
MSGQDGDASLSRTQSAEGTSSGLGGDRSIQTPSEQRITDINTRCREIIKKYKDGIIGKDLAIDEVKKIVPGSGEEPTSGAFRAYLSILDNHEAFSRTIGNASRGRNQLLGHLDDGHGTDPATPPTGNPGNPAGVTNIVQPVEEHANDQQRGKRIRERRDEDNEEDEDDERPRKKLDLTALPWTIQEASSNRQLSNELKKTRSILENISRDPKSAKSSLLNCFSCPQFPDSEWTNLLAGRSVNLDHVISGLCSLSNEERTSEKIGTVQISLGPAAAVVQVRTHGEWVIAWEKPSELQHSFFPTANPSSEPTASTSPAFSPLFRSEPTTESSNSTRPSASAWANVGTSNFPTTSASPTYTSSGSSLPAQRATQPPANLPPAFCASGIAADDGTRAVARTPLALVITPTPAKAAKPATTPNQIVRDYRKSEIFERWKSRPRYARNLVWADSERPRVLSVDATLTAEPFPDPPTDAPHTLIPRQTIVSHPELFKIVCPINVDLFELYLADHPNPLFVASVCKGMREGFWPHTDTSDPSLPVTCDNSDRYTVEEYHEVTVLKDIEAEVAADRYSPNFGPDLLPGMYSMPLFVIPKPRTTKWCVVVDHSAEPHSLNSCIPREKFSVTLDNMHDLGLALRHAHSNHPGEPLTLFKSDVSQAYRRLPMHPLWQIRQIVSFKGKHNVDRCNIWGDRGAGNIWCSFMGLVLWIAREIKKIEDMFAYVDDSFSWDFAGNLELYEPYDAFLPEKQVRLLQLWDELNIPHE